MPTDADRSAANCWESLRWAAENQTVNAYGQPSDPADAGRLTVRENADALRRLRDA